MMCLIPRSDSGALTEYRRPHAGGVSTERGARLPHGPFPRLVMLWMYADCVRDPRERQDPVSSLCDFLLALGVEWMDIAPLFEQAARLFACRFRMGNRVIPVIEASVLQRARAAVSVPDVPSLRGMELAYSTAFRQEMAGRRFAPCMHTLRALRQCSFALDVCLWDACYAARPPQGASPVCARLAAYYALADHPSRPPSLSEVLAFERELATVREQRQRLEAQGDGPPPAGPSAGVPPRPRSDAP